MLPWLMERGEVPVAEMAARFELTEAELVGDLELAAMCGLPPFVDEMIDVFIDEGVVFAGVPRLFTKPLRLTAPEGFALLIVGPGGDAAARRRSRRRRWPGRSTSWPAVLGDDGVVVDVPQPPATADLAAAVNDSARLRVRYWSANRDEATEREITPRSIFLDRGHWYVIADDSRSGRVAHVPHRPVRAVGAHRRDRSAAPTAPRRRAAERRSVVRRQRRAVGRAAARAAGALGGRAVSVAREHREADEAGAIVVRMAVASEQWLRTLLLRLGPARRGARAGGVARPRRRRGATSCWQRYETHRQLSGAGDAVGRAAGGAARRRWRRRRRARRAAAPARCRSARTVGEAVRQLPIGVEPARQRERAQRVRRSARRRRASCRPCAGTRHRTPRCGRRSGHRRAARPTRVSTCGPGGAARTIAAADAVDADGPDPEPPPPRGRDQAGPPIEHPAVAIDHDEADLQHVMAAQRQPRRLDIDDGEAHLVELRIHEPNHTPGV